MRLSEVLHAQKGIKFMMPPTQTHFGKQCTPNGFFVSQWRVVDVVIQSRVL